MDAPAHGKQRSGIQHPNIPAGVGIFQPLTRRVVAGIIEAWANDRTVTGVVINVAVVHPITVISQRERRLEREYLETFITELLSNCLLYTSDAADE